MMRMNRLFLVSAVALATGGCETMQQTGYTGDVVTAYGNETGPRRFIKADMRIGCATVLAVRNLNQQPAYDMQYESQFGSASGSADIASLGVQTGVLGVGAAVAGMLATDAVVSEARPTERQIKLLRVPTNAQMVKAVKLGLDDGAEVNLPLLDAPKLSFGSKYKVGGRYMVYYSPTFENLQVIKGALKDKYESPEEGAKDLERFCKRTLTDDKAKAVLAANANKVDESKVY